MLTFLSNIPIWVAPLFILLVFLGLRSTRRRRVPVVLLYLLPLLGILTLRNLVDLNPALWVWIISVAAYGFSMWSGYLLQQGWILAKDGRFVEVQGEWLTFTAMMILFAAGFVLGVADAIAPNALLSPLFHVIYCSAITLASGQFFGRAIAAAKA